jgi:hypothetical protein
MKAFSLFPDANTGKDRLHSLSARLSAAESASYGQQSADYTYDNGIVGSSSSRNNRGNDSAPRQRPTSAAPTGHQKPKRPSSANPTGRSRPGSARGGNLRGKHGVKQAAQGNQSDDENSYQHVMNREDLYFELNAAKKKVLVLESTVSNLRTENQRLEKELSRNQHRLDKLLEATNGGKIGLSAEARREIEKGLLVRQLKLQVQAIREALTEKEAEIQAQNKSLKASHLLELASEKDEYYAEILRLQRVVKELRDELQAEKQRREWSRNLGGGGGPVEQDIRSEVAKLTQDYQKILETYSARGSSPDRRVGSSLSPSSLSPNSRNKPRPTDGNDPIYDTILGPSPSKVRSCALCNVKC